MCSLPTTLQLSPHLHLAFFSDFPLDVNKENAQGVRGKWEMGGWACIGVNTSKSTAAASVIEKFL